MYWYLVQGTSDPKFQLKKFSGGFLILKCHGSETENYFRISAANNQLLF